MTVGELLRALEQHDPRATVKLSGRVWVLPRAGEAGDGEERRVDVDEQPELEVDEDERGVLLVARFD